MGDRLAAVTGATGFLGRHIVSALASAGWRVRILARQGSKDRVPDGKPLETIIGDIGDRRAVAALIDGADVVVHAAGLIKASNLAAFRSVNVGGTTNLVRALGDCKAAKRVLLVSSMVAREPQLSNYAATKREGEEALKELRVHDWTVVRPCAVYGPWDKETLMLFQAAVRRILPLLGPRRGRVALIHAEDAAKAIASLCDQGPSGRIFELTDGRFGGYTWPEIVIAAETAMGAKVITVPLPGNVVRAAAAANMLVARVAGRVPIFTLGKAREILHADWGSSAGRLPPPDIWQPKIDLSTGFRDTVSWYRDRQWLPAVTQAQPGFCQQ
jgi:nucleoside-diphosphate-sugar epimerase